MSDMSVLKPAPQPTISSRTPALISWDEQTHSKIKAQDTSTGKIPVGNQGLLPKWTFESKKKLSHWKSQLQSIPSHAIAWKWPNIYVQISDSCMVSGSSGFSRCSFDSNVPTALGRQPVHWIGLCGGHTGFCTEKLKSKTAIFGIK